MCNTYGLTHPLTAINQAFSEVGQPLLFPTGAPNLEPRPDIRPTEAAPIVRATSEGAFELVQLRWGFPPPPGRRGPPVINFRSEGRRFENGQGAARCLAPLTCFYEFIDPGPDAPRRSPKNKWEFTLAAPDESEPPLFCLGAWMRRDPVVAGGAAFSLLTCAPGPDVAALHDRQVVVLAQRHWRTWLEGSGAEALALVGPLPAGTLKVRRVR